MGKSVEKKLQNEIHIISDMDRNILELKSIWIAPEKIQSLEQANHIPELEGFNLKEEFFERVYSPEDIVESVSCYREGETYETSVRVSEIVGTIHPDYCKYNWVVMMMSLKRHKTDFDVVKVLEAISNNGGYERIHLFKFEKLYFIAGGGNHRVCQAKFLGVERVPCEVTEKVLDEEAFKERMRWEGVFNGRDHGV